VKTVIYVLLMTKHLPYPEKIAAFTVLYPDLQAQKRD